MNTKDHKAEIRREHDLALAKYEAARGAWMKLPIGTVDGEQAREYVELTRKDYCKAWERWEKAGRP